LQNAVKQGGTLDVQSAAQPAAGAQNTCSTFALMLTATQAQPLGPSFPQHCNQTHARLEHCSQL
jgi:hypothetical protein